VEMEVQEELQQGRVVEAELEATGPLWLAKSSSSSSIGSSSSRSSNPDASKSTRGVAPIERRRSACLFIEVLKDKDERFQPGSASVQPQRGVETPPSRDMARQPAKAWCGNTYSTSRPTLRRSRWRRDSLGQRSRSSAVAIGAASRCDQPGVCAGDLGCCPESAEASHEPTDDEESASPPPGEPCEEEEEEEEEHQQCAATQLDLESNAEGSCDDSPFSEGALGHSTGALRACERRTCGGVA